MIFLDAPLVLKNGENLMRRFFSRGALPWVALLGLTQAIDTSAHADWFEAYEADTAAVSMTASPPQEIAPSIADALDANIDELTSANSASATEEGRSPLQLTSFLESVASTFNASSCDTVNCSSASRNGGLLPPWRPYVGVITGVTFATLDDDNSTTPAVINESVFTAGGTIGVAFERPMGALRLEFEGRGRDQITNTASDPVLGDLTLRATDIWSATINVWRDYQPYESLGFYAGGGLGSGGYRSTLSGTGLIGASYSGNDPVTNFAWQAGGGVFYNLTERATIDLGYRFFAIDESTVVAEFLQQPFTYRERYSASELLLTLRIYEPFQRWR